MSGIWRRRRWRKRSVLAAELHPAWRSLFGCANCAFHFSVLKTKMSDQCSGCCKMHLYRHMCRHVYRLCVGMCIDMGSVICRIIGELSSTFITEMLLTQMSNVMSKVSHRRNTDTNTRARLPIAITEMFITKWYNYFFITKTLQRLPGSCSHIS